jgi:hypothetical protein
MKIMAVSKIQMNEYEAVRAELYSFVGQGNPNVHIFIS